LAVFRHLMNLTLIHSRLARGRCLLSLFACLAGTVVVARANANVVPLDLSKQVFDSGTLSEQGVAFQFDMGVKRVNWTNARWSQTPFKEPRDWSAYSGLRITVTTTQPRSDAGVYIALREADGSWHYHGWAVDLTAERNTGTIRFEDFRPATWVAPHVYGMPMDFLDENQALDVDAIAGMAIGCINPLGIGKVAFTVEKVELVPAVTEAPDPVTITVSGKTIDINGTTVVPAGLFGHFPGGGKREMRMGSHREIFASYMSWTKEKEIVAHPLFTEPGMAILAEVEGGDRYQPSGRLTDPKWEEMYRNMGISKGKQYRAWREQATKSGWHAELVFEWWNEPYLNWSNRTRVHFRPNYFDETKAVEGGPVHLTVDGSVAPFLRWTKKFDVPPWQWASRTEWGGDVSPKWYVYDETQFTFWSGQSQLKFYNEPLLAYASGLHQEAPDAPLIAGWDFRCSEDHWEGFRMLYKPTIDAAIKHIIGVTDHDYGGDVTVMPANYEFVTAYGMAKYNKWLYSYNTECGENSDPSAMPAANASMQQAGKSWLKTMWSSRKIVHALATVPDKARSFMFHWFSSGGEGVTMTALRNLRGKLVEVRSTDPDVFAVAAIDGTDTRQPRPDYVGDGKELVVALFNDHRTTRRVQVPITAPEGMQLNGGIRRQPVQESETGHVRIDEQMLESKGTSAVWEGEIPSKTLVVLSYKVQGNEPDQPHVLRRQFFGDDVLKPVSASSPASTGVILNVTVPETERKGAKRAWLRCVFERLAEGEGKVDVNGTVIELPRCQPPENSAWIRDIEIPVELIQSRNTLRFTATDRSAGYLLVMASLMIDGDAVTK
jgi:hypothetical protein